MSIVNDFPVAQAALGLKELFCALRPKSDYPLDDQIASWRHLIVTGHKVFAAGDAVKTVGSFTVPANCSWIVYHVALITLIVDGALTSPALNISAEAINLQNSTNPDSSIQFVDGNGAALTPSANFWAYQAQQILYVFDEGTEVNLRVDPQTVGGDAAESIFSAINGFLVPPQVGAVVSSLNTNWISQANAY